MEIKPTTPPRSFQVGGKNPVTLTDCAAIELQPDELVTFRTEGAPGTAFDVTRKSFGYYVGNSLNGTLPRQGLRAALCRNQATGMLFLLYVEIGKEADYETYLTTQGMVQVAWLDET